jgi:FkbM family methyltransferase
MRLKALHDYLLWRLILTRPRVQRVLSRVFFPSREEFVTFGLASVCIHCQEELGVYRIGRATSRLRYLRQEVPMLLAAMAVLEPGAVFVDCGANVGTWCANVAALAPILPGIKILAFEPHPGTFARLTKTMARYSNAECYNVALSDRRRHLELNEGAGSQTFGVAKSNFQIKGRTRVVEARPLDEFLLDRDRLFIKIDVEGHEYEVLSGARQALASGRVRTVLIDGCDPEYRQKIVTDLREFGFVLRDLHTLEPLGADGDRILALPGALPAARTIPTNAATTNMH